MKDIFPKNWYEIEFREYSKFSSECQDVSFMSVCSLLSSKSATVFEMTCIWFNLQRKAFEEDRATWLKHQFLNLSPFADSKKPPMSKSKSAFLICECPLLYIVLMIMILGCQ